MAAAEAPPPLEVGEGGKLNHKLAEAALERRGNATIIAELKDAARVYDPVQEKSWQQKYNFFSSGHMKGTYRTYARARHDPFNKDPSWGQAVMHDVGQACTGKGIHPSELFRGLDLTGDGNLNRPEMKRVLCSVLPTLSDMEVAAVFDTIDKDRSGEVNVSEFCELVEGGRTKPIPKEMADRWRNPIHRMKRYPPARIEGWDHIVQDPCQEMRFDDFCHGETQKVMDNLGGVLTATRALQHVVEPPKYEYFAGGGDARRFRHQAWVKEGRGSACSTERVATPPSFPDPGPDLRPGFLCDPRGRQSPVAQGFAALTPTPRTVRGASRGAAARAKTPRPGKGSALPRPGTSGRPLASAR